MSFEADFLSINGLPELLVLDFFFGLGFDLLDVHRVKRGDGTYKEYHEQLLRESTLPAAARVECQNLGNGATEACFEPET